MILVLLGTQDKEFKRLLDAVQLQINKGNIKEKVVVQAGCTKYDTKDMEIFDLIPVDEFSDLIKKADLIITHGGVGSIMEGVKQNKKVIAAARLKKYNEHVNDHQLQIISNFVNDGYILELDNFDELDKVIELSKKFKLKKYKSNTNNLIHLIDEYIKKN